MFRVFGARYVLGLKVAGLRVQDATIFVRLAGYYPEYYDTHSAKRYM
jgi:hypothetical protein